MSGVTGGGWAETRLQVCLVWGREMPLASPVLGPLLIRSHGPFCTAAYSEPRFRSQFGGRVQSKTSSALFNLPPASECKRSH
jgi:hypothetical protein